MKKIGVLLFLGLFLISIGVYGAASSGEGVSLLRAYDPFFNDWTYPSDGSCTPALYWHNRTTSDSFRAGYSLSNLLNNILYDNKVYLRSGAQVDLYGICLEDRDGNVIPDGQSIRFFIRKYDDGEGDHVADSIYTTIQGGKAFISINLNYLGNEGHPVPNEGDGEHEFSFDASWIFGSATRRMFYSHVQPPRENQLLYMKDPTLPVENFVDSCGNRPEYSCNEDHTRCVSSEGYSVQTKICASDYYCRIVPRVRGPPTDVECTQKKSAGESCTNGYECLSNGCANGQCTSGELATVCDSNVDCAPEICRLLNNDDFFPSSTNPFGGGGICVSNEEWFGNCGSRNCGGTGSDRCIGLFGEADQVCRSDSYCGTLSNGRDACIYRKPNGASCSQGYECQSNTCSGAGLCTVDVRTDSGTTGGITGGATSKDDGETLTATDKGIDTKTCTSEYYWHTLDDEDSRAGAGGIQTFVQSGRRVRAYATCIKDSSDEIVPDGREVTFTVIERDGFLLDDTIGSLSATVEGSEAHIDVVARYIGEENPFDKTNEFYFNLECEENEICGNSGTRKLDMIYVREPTARFPAIVNENPVTECTKDSQCGSGSTCDLLLELCVEGDGTVKRETTTSITVGTTSGALEETDTDGDGMPDRWEAENRLNPDDDGDASLDFDADGLTNLEEYSRGTNPRVRDSDGDGILDSEETVADEGTEIVDTDGDGMPDSWEIENGLNPNKNSDASEDADSDGLTNLEEYNNRTDPNNSDTDGDGIKDAVDSTPAEVPAETDTDGDGMPDSWETDHGLNPNDPSDASFDPDGDGLTNLEEYNSDTDPNNSDSDGDGVLDNEDPTPAGDTGVTSGDSGGSGGGGGGGGGGSTRDYCQVCDAEVSDCNSGNFNADGECCGGSCSTSYLSSVYGETETYFQNAYICEDRDLDGLAERYRITCLEDSLCVAERNAITMDDVDLLAAAGVESGFSQDGYCDYADAEIETGAAEDVPAYSIFSILLSIFILAGYYIIRRRL